MRGPTKPVCRVDEPCQEPAKGLTLQFKRAGHVVARVKTSQRGTYSVKLRPGSYAVTPLPRPQIGAGLTPRVVRVPRGRVARRDFHLDTGLQ
jgi:hypothetical protein